MRLDIADLGGILEVGHFFLAHFLGEPDLMLAPEEIKRLVSALDKVGETYEIEMTPRQAAWTKLTLTVGGIYGPRVGRIAWRRLFPPSADGSPESGPAAAGTLQ